MYFDFTEAPKPKGRAKGSKNVPKTDAERAEAFWKAHPDATVADTAAAAGFADQFYFSRVFRKRRGIPPGKFRDQLKNIHPEE